MNNRSSYNLLWICMMLLCIASCVSEFPVNNDPNHVSEKGILTVPMTRGTLEDESNITSARMIVFRQNGDFVINTNQPKDPAPYNYPTFRDTVPVGYLNVYLIANELTEWNLGAVNSEAQLQQIIYDYYNHTAYATKLPEADATHSIPMFGTHKGILIDINGNTSTDLTSPNPPSAPYPITVSRIFSKVTLKLNCLFTEQANGGTPVELKSITLKQVPEQSYLVAQRYFGSVFRDYPAFFPNPATPPTGWPLSTYTESATGFQDSLTFYLPEYIANDTSKYTYLSIKVNVKDAPLIDKEYKLVLGEGLVYSNKFMLGDSIVNGHERDVLDLSILRNTHYVIGAKITNFSLTGDQDLEVSLRVEDWNSKAIDPIDIGDFNVTINPSAFQVPTTSFPFTGVIMIDTDYSGGWSVTGVSANVTLLGGVALNQIQHSTSLRFTVVTAAAGYIDIKVGHTTKRIRINVLP